MEKIEGIFGYKLGDVYVGDTEISVKPTSVLPYRKLQISTTTTTKYIYCLKAHRLCYAATLTRLKIALTQKYGESDHNIWVGGDRKIVICTKKSKNINYFDNYLWDIDKKERDALEV